MKLSWKLMRVSRIFNVIANCNTMESFLSLPLSVFSAGDIVQRERGEGLDRLDGDEDPEGGWDIEEDDLVLPADLVCMPYYDYHKLYSGIFYRN